MYVFVLHYIVLICTILYCIVLHCIILYCIALYCTVFYCIVLYTVLITRPISLLPILSKVCEKLALKQFVNYLNCNSKIAKQQSGNRQFHSTETALPDFTDEILKNMDEKKVSLVVLLDISKAFDSINHELLLSKLRKIGVSTSVHKRFKRYLIDRSQVVKIEDTTSKALHWNSECPKGPYLALFCSPSMLTTCH